jgi:hypothetical protein
VAGTISPPLKFYVFETPPDRAILQQHHKIKGKVKLADEALLIIDIVFI